MLSKISISKPTQFSKKKKRKNIQSDVTLHNPSYFENSKIFHKIELPRKQRHFDVNFITLQSLILISRPFVSRGPLPS